MRKITITDGVNTVTLLKDLIFTISNDIIGTKAQMASGRTVMDIVGTKTSLEIPVGYLGREDVELLRRMINTKHFLTISYPDVDGDRVGLFEVEPIAIKSFRYDNDGVSQWYGFTLKATATEVD